MEDRGCCHDRSKLESPEVELFDKYTHLLAGFSYGTPEYEAMREKLKPALDHHYANNRHHPEHWAQGVKDMDVLDLAELVCDWKAAGERQNDGNILTSLEVNKERYGLADVSVYDVLKNTIDRYLS